MGSTGGAAKEAGSTDDFNRSKSLFVKTWDINKFVEQEAHAEAEEEPLLIAKWMIKCPCFLCLLMLIVNVALAFAFIYEFQNGLLELEGFRHYYVEGERATDDWEAFNEARGDTEADHRAREDRHSAHARALVQKGVRQALHHSECRGDG